MRDTTNQILNASLEVFKEKGYLRATTKEIARLAGVAEVTLYRKFSTKKALFEATLRKHLNLSFEATAIDPHTKSDTFIPKILENRLERMSRQRDFIRLLIRESLSNDIPEDLHFDLYVETRIKAIIATHMRYIGSPDNTEEVTRMIIGILLSYVIIPSETPFYKREAKQRQSIVDAYTSMIVKAIDSDNQQR
ncbi:MAG: TetR/AcrR family transcriptional regulator [Bacillota bacterium]